MTYATETDIENELKGITFGATSIPTSAAVADFLTQADAIINMYLSKRYATPIVDADALNIVKKIAIDFVTYRVVKILDLSKSNPIPDSNIIQQIDEGSAYRESMKMLAAIRDNKMDLLGVSEISSAGGLASFHTESGNSEIVPYFQKGVDQW